MPGTGKRTPDCNPNPGLPAGEIKRRNDKSRGEPTDGVYDQPVVHVPGSEMPYWRNPNEEEPPTTDEKGVEVVDFTLKAE